MVAIAAGTQQRILEAAERHLGPSAADLMKSVCRTRLDTPWEKLEFHQIPLLVRAVEADAGGLLRQRADALVNDIRQIQLDVEAGMPGRLVTSVSRLLGPSAEPFMRNVAQRIGVVLERVDRGVLNALAAEAALDARPIFGDETADALGSAIRRAGHVKPAGMVASVLDAAQRHIGVKGERFIRDICHAKLETDLDEIEPEALGLLADAISGEAVSFISGSGATAFAQAVASALTSPNHQLRGRVADIARKMVGPAGEDFMRRSCRKAGMPWDAVDAEHLMWLAEVVRAEAAPLLGKGKADDFAKAVRNLLMGN